MAATQCEASLREGTGVLRVQASLHEGARLATTSRQAESRHVSSSQAQSRHVKSRRVESLRDGLQSVRAGLQSSREGLADEEEEKNDEGDDKDNDVDDYEDSYEDDDDETDDDEDAFTCVAAAHLSTAVTEQRQVSDARHRQLLLATVEDACIDPLHPSRPRGQALREYDFTL